MISKLSNQDLDANLKRLVASERKILHVILEHINEVASRKLYLDMAYSSLYEYLVKECQYSGSAAMRRISAAQLLREVPVIAEKIQSGALNLSQISELSRAIKEKEKSGVQVSPLQKSELACVISGKTTAETQKEISVSLDLEIKAPEKKFVQKDDSVRVELTLSQGQYKQLLKCKDLAAHTLLTENQDTSLAAVIGYLANQYLKGKKVNTDNADSDRPNVFNSKGLEVLEGPFSQKINKTNKPKINRTLTPKVRREVFLRDQCCQFKDPRSGKICGSTFGLEVDHKQPRWASGDNSPANLQTLCRAHNSFKYQREANLRLL